MNFRLAPSRLYSVVLLLGLLLTVALEPALADGIPGYAYTVQTNDTLEDLAKAYRDQGVGVTAKQILVANPNVKFTTNTMNGVLSLIPEIGAQLFIPGQVVKQSQDMKMIAPRLIEPLRFANFTVSQINSKDGITNLLNQKVYIGTDDPNAYLFLSKNETNFICTETVNEFRKAIKDGFAAKTTADMTAESWLLQDDQVLSFMERAKPSQHSLFSVTDYKYLPISLLNWTEGEEGERLKEAALNGMTLNDCTSIFAKHRIHSLKIKNNGMTFSDNGCDYAVQELARGDWDGDGYEDALVLVSTYYLGGSGRFYEVYVVSKNPKLRQLKLSVQDAVLQSTTDSAIDKK